MKIYLFVFVIFLSACGEAIVGGKTSNTPESNFDAFWQEYDQHFANFESRDINWKAQYDQFRPKVNTTTTQEELWTILTDMLKVIGDPHCSIWGDNRYFNSANNAFYRAREIFNLHLVSDFLTDKGLSDDKAFHFGKVSDSIAYLHIWNFVDTDIENLISIIDSMGETKGLILDIRSNSGGHPNNVSKIASLFAEQSKLVFSRRFKNGEGHDDFTEFTDIYLEPNPSFSYLKPVVLLTNNASVSAADGFAMTMSELDNVTIMGENTAGAFSTFNVKTLPNGWTFTVSYTQVFNANGENLEGMGVSPDIYLEADIDSLAIGVDNVLQAAISHIENK